MSVKKKKFCIWNSICLNYRMQIWLHATKVKFHIQRICLILSLGSDLDFNFLTQFVGQHVMHILSTVSWYGWLFADCPHRKFGLNCNATCHCAGDAPCDDPVSGVCPEGGCESEWEGAKCALPVVGEWCMSWRRLWKWMGGSQLHTACCRWVVYVLKEAVTVNGREQTVHCLL